MASLWFLVCVSFVLRSGGLACVPPRPLNRRVRPRKVWCARLHSAGPSQQGGVMRKGFCMATAPWLVTVAAIALGNGQVEKDPAKALLEMGADVRHDLPFKCVYQSVLDD